MPKKKKLQGHYCCICDERKPNEAFSGKGHTKYVCKECEALPQEKKNELQIINRIERAGEKYPKTRRDWELLEKYAKSNKYPEAKEFALFFLEMSGRNISDCTRKIEKITYTNTIVYSEIDEYNQEEIHDDLYDRIMYFMILKDRIPDQKDKQKILDKFCKDFSHDYGDQLVQEDGLNALFDEILMEVVNDLADNETE